MAALICLELEKGTPEEEIYQLFSLDKEYQISFQFYIDFSQENNWIVKDKESGKYIITKYGREFVNAILKIE